MTGPGATQARHARGLTLIELLVVLAIIGLLAALLLPTLAGAKTRAQAIQCRSNLRQLHLGWSLFVSDHDDALPPNSDGELAGKVADRPSWVAGWLRTAHEAGDKSDGTNTALLVDPAYAAFGSIGVYVKNPEVYRCPADRSGRVRSMSMNCYLNGNGVWQDPGYVTYRRLGQIGDPSQTWVFMDEREDSINDGYFAVHMSGRYVLLDYPAAYHGGSGNVVFADGHVEGHRWVEPTTRPPLVAGEHLSLLPKFTSPTDRDLQWLTERTTVKAP